MTNQASRRWLLVTTSGCAMVIIAMIVSALVLFDKPHFGWLVGSMFLPAITSGVLLGSALMVAGVLKLAEPWSWRRIVLLLWALIALTSPLFGFLFLMPWSVLVLMLPVVIVILVTSFRARVAAA